ncbi:MAG: transcriptional regulator [Gammaproteobacteria bacterium]|nr:MAG: transcriptional regulator [Gammaproteobacteria bacterium]
MKQVQAMTSLSRSYIYSLQATQNFPKSFALVPGGTSRAWLQSEVQDWINQRIAERDKQQ